MGEHEVAGGSRATAPESGAGGGDGGGDDDDDSASSLRDMMAFTSKIIDQVLQSDNRQRFLNNIQNGILLRTCYSGVGSEGIALRWISTALQAAGLLADGTWMTWHSACDTSPLARRMLAAFPCSSGPAHVFENLMDRHSKETRRKLDGVSWPEPEKKKRRQAQQHDEEDDDCVIVSVEGDCMEGLGSREGEGSETGQHLTQTLNAIYETNKILGNSDSYSPAATAYCAVHSDFCPMLCPKPATGFSVLSGGMTCVDFSPIGSGAGYAGKSTKPSLSFQGSFAADSVDIGLLECAAAWNSSLFASKIRGTHRLIPLEPRPCPSRLGWPVRRDRYWGVVLREGLQLTIPWSTFSAAFEKPMTITAHDFFVDSQEEADKELKQAARRVGGALLAGEKLNWEEHGLTGGQATFLKAFRESHTSRLQQLQDKGAATPPGMQRLLCDLHHNPDTRPRMSLTGCAPSLLTHGLYWSDEARRPMTKREIVSLQGFPSIASAHGSLFPVPWQSLIDELSPENWSQLMGNGMHMHVLVLVWVWILACVDKVGDT